MGKEDPGKVYETDTGEAIRCGIMEAPGRCDYICAIDPGGDGAAAIIDMDCNVLGLCDCPKEVNRIPEVFNTLLARVMSDVRIANGKFKASFLDRTIFVIEAIGNRPTGKGYTHVESPSKNTTFILNAGIWLGQLYRVAPDRTISPVPVTWQTAYTKLPTWRKKYAASKSRNKKIRSVTTALHVYAGKITEDALRGPRGGYYDGRSDALLIANWGRYRGLQMLSAQRAIQPGVQNV